ncbi:hypothetical protein ACJMK2_041679 [Sinanodonta woodiana]|uniref:Uncharacterized protein n=1 Tax=Sinanodonta woodiana TaxID=1069815 RepID=A0ABD3W849_SINWO
METMDKMSHTTACKHCFLESSHTKTKLMHPVNTVKHGGVFTFYTQPETSRTSSNISEGFTAVPISGHTIGHTLGVLDHVTQGTVQAFITEKEEEEISFKMMQRKKSLPKGSENLQSLLKEFKNNSKEIEEETVSADELNSQKLTKRKNDLYVSCKRFPLVCINRKVGLHHCVHNH